MPLWTPSRISTALWIDFSDSSSITVSSGISQANDKSGNGRHLLQAISANRPAYTTAQQNGLNVATFDGVNDCLSLASDLSLGTAHSIFIAGRISGTITAASPFRMLLNGGVYTVGSTTTSEFLLGTGSVTGTLSNERLSSIVLAHITGSSQIYGYGKTNSDISGPFITSSAYTTSGNSFRGRLNGQNDFATTATPGGYSSTNTRYPTVLRHLGARYGTSDFWNGEIWEVIVVPGYLRLEETERIEGYLAWKWGVEASLPVGHRFYSAAPQAPTGIGGEIAWWCPSLDDTGNGTTTLYDLIGSNNGTLTNMDAATDWVADTANGGVRALDFDYVAGASRQAVQLPNSVSVSNYATASVALWCLLQAAPTNNAGLYYESTSSNGFTKFAIFQLANNQVLFIARDTESGSSFSITASPPTGQWIHLCGCYDANTDRMELFVNGVSVGTNLTAKGVLHNSTPASPITIGAFTQNATAEYSCNALIDDTRVFSRILTQTEITALASQRGYQRPSNTRRRRQPRGFGL